MFQRVCAMTFTILFIAGCGQMTPQATTVPSAPTAPAATAVPTALAATAMPSPASVEAGTPNVMKIVFSSGPDSSPDSIKFRFEQAKYQVCDGKYTIVYERWDNTASETGYWDTKHESDNANKAINDPDVMVYLGPPYSGAAKVSIPILNRANLMMISPSASLPGLTKPNTGQPGEPDVYYPTGKRNFARVIPSDEIQGVVAAVWAKQLGADSVAVLYDDDSYSKTIIQIFETKAKTLGLSIVANELFNNEADNYTDLVAKVIANKPSLLYIAGISNLPTLISAVRDSGYTGMIMGPDSFNDQTFLNEAGEKANGIYITSGGVPADQLTNKGKQLVADFTKAFNQAPELYTPFYYDTASVALAGIEKVCVKDRAAIRDAIMATKNFEGVSGTWSFDANGDTSLTTMSGLQVKDGKYEFVSLLNE